MALKKKTKTPVTFEDLVDEPSITKVSDTATNVIEEDKSEPEKVEEDIQEKTPEDSSAPLIRIKFVESGFTYLGKVWLRGETYEVEAGSAEYEKTKDRNGDSWLDLARDPEGQKKRYRNVLFEEA